MEGTKRKLSTIDKVLKWVIAVEADCVLCNTPQEKIFNHLFFVILILYVVKNFEMAEIQQENGKLRT